MGRSRKISALFPCAVPSTRIPRLFLSAEISALRTSWAHVYRAVSHEHRWLRVLGAQHNNLCTKISDQSQDNNSPSAANHSESRNATAVKELTKPATKQARAFLTPASNQNKNTNKEPWDNETNSGNLQQTATQKLNSRRQQLLDTSTRRYLASCDCNLVLQPGRTALVLELLKNCSL